MIAVRRLLVAARSRPRRGQMIERTIDVDTVVVRVVGRARLICRDARELAGGCIHRH